MPLELAFVGVTVHGIAARNTMMNEVCYKKVADSLRAGNQVMVFVHSRKDTGKTARALAELAARAGDGALFSSEDHPQRGLYLRDVRKSRNREVAELFETGFGMHHAGMLRPDRSLTERLFAEGLIKVCCCCCVCVLLLWRACLMITRRGCFGVTLSSQPTNAHPYSKRTQKTINYRCCAARPRWRGASTCRRTRWSSRAPRCTTPSAARSPT